MKPLDLEAIEEAARNVKPGTDYDSYYVNALSWARFDRLATPKTILSLIAEVRRLRSENTEAWERVGEAEDVRLERAEARLAQAERVVEAAREHNCAPVRQASDGPYIAVGADKRLADELASYEKGKEGRLG